jgi:hypothetical protein
MKKTALFRSALGPRFVSLQPMRRPAASQVQGRDAQPISGPRFVVSEPLVSQRLDIGFPADCPGIKEQPSNELRSVGWVRHPRSNVLGTKLIAKYTKK